MVTSDSKMPATQLLLWLALLIALVLPFGSFLASVSRIWFNDPEFSYGMLIPVIAGYLLWTRRERFDRETKVGRPTGLILAVAGCALQVVGSLSGTLVVSGVAFVTVLMGIILFLWGGRVIRIAFVPMALLILMVPVPSYAVGQVSWRLQAAASTASSATLRLFSVPVYQDGNLLNLPNYVLEVKQACSGSRSIFALLAMALILGLSVKCKWWARIVLLAAAPVLAAGANVLRIVGTGLIANQWGAVAAKESLHMTWGIVVFVIAVSGLLALLRLLQWTSNEYA
jgi:exosortase